MCGNGVKNKFTRLISKLLPYFRTKRIWIGFTLVAVLLALTVTIGLFPGNDGGFLSYKQDVRVILYDDKSNILVNGDFLARLEGNERCERLCSSLDGSVAAFLTEKQERYVVDGQRLKKIANDVHHFEISASGKGIAYAQQYVDQYTLTLYSVADRISREITDTLSRLDFSLSPEGQAVAYYQIQDGQEIVKVHRKGKSHTVTKEAADLVGLSDDGKFVYAVCSKARDQSILCSFTFRGKKQELGGVSSLSFKFNADHTQLMFYHGGKTYISSNSQEGVLASEYPLYLVTAPNSQSTADKNAITYPVSSLYNHVYTCSDGECTSAWLISKKQEKSIKLVSRVSGCTLDSSMKYLYYLHDMKQLRCIRIADGKKAGEAYQGIADNVEAYALTSDRKNVYFTESGALYSVNGRKGGDPLQLGQISNGCLPTLNQNNVLYYQHEDTLYLCRNGRKSTVVADNIEAVYNSSNSVVYIRAEDGLYTSVNKKQPKLVSQ